MTCVTILGTSPSIVAQYEDACRQKLMRHGLATTASVTDVITLSAAHERFGSGTTQSTHHDPLIYYTVSEGTDCLIGGYSDFIKWMKSPAVQNLETMKKNHKWKQHLNVYLPHQHNKCNESKFIYKKNVMYSVPAIIFHLFLLPIRIIIYRVLRIVTKVYGTENLASSFEDLLNTDEYRSGCIAKSFPHEVQMLANRIVGQHTNLVSVGGTLPYVVTVRLNDRCVVPLSDLCRGKLAVINIGGLKSTAYMNQFKEFLELSRQYSKDVVFITICVTNSSKCQYEKMRGRYMQLKYILSESINKEQGVPNVHFTIDNSEDTVMNYFDAYPERVLIASDIVKYSSTKNNYNMREVAEVLKRILGERN